MTESLSERGAVDPRPLILTALVEPAVQARFEALRRAHYPTALNRVPAHISMFHHLPGRELDAVKRRLKAVCAQVPPPEIAVNGLRSLGGGVALKLQSPALEDVRAELAAGWNTLLIPQDRAGYRPHMTVQNKVTSAAAKGTLAALEATFVPFATRAVAIAIWRYLDGPWEALGQVAFRGR
ncbi:2'-5' RNA ligase family protein [Sandarakinorhabdus sp. DWP1-3-1]|uniref:2'-5' RNA ligase family protein n=1 Tax=Sandarakinorhabdus sp. DWP1-3-1 TaxID=2804627 RepID=UPI003CF2BE50